MGPRGLQGRCPALKTVASPCCYLLVHSGAATVGSGPVQPSKCTSSSFVFFQHSMSAWLGTGGWSGPRVGFGRYTYLIWGDLFVTCGGSLHAELGAPTGLQDLLPGLRSLVQQFDTGSPSGAPPVAAWVQHTPGGGNAAVPGQPGPPAALGSGVLPVTTSGDTVV